MRLKIVTWNVNGLRSAYRQGLRSYIERERPHVLCLQEIRADPQQLDADMHPPSMYHELYAPSRVRKGYSGVAIFSRLAPDTITEGIGVEQFDQEGRLLRADFGSLTVVSVYCPKGYSPDDARSDPGKIERLHYKLAFYDALARYVRSLHSQGRHVVLSGDFNTAHRELDLARPKENERTSGFLPEERAAFDRLLATGLVDAFRVFVHEGGHYTWWSQRRGARQRNIGWRIDYHLVSSSLVPFLKAAYLQPDVLGSDHCPAVIELDSAAVKQ
ncbi:MAG: exodeoxyribonuclease III [Chloroflexus sp.]|nr:MAG: exodeoxyribonuclease III [Candidatus Kapabacteria bacterium]GIV86671.1 MAG: exodeoxyribonuclease III [Chloroflexus sp.]